MDKRGRRLAGRREEEGREEEKDAAAHNFKILRLTVGCNLNPPL